LIHQHRAANNPQACNQAAWHPELTARLPLLQMSVGKSNCLKFLLSQALPPNGSFAHLLHATGTLLLHKTVQTEYCAQPARFGSVQYLLTWKAQPIPQNIILEVDAVVPQ